MLQQLENYVAQETINNIVNIIIEQYSRFKRLMNSEQFQAVFLEEYAPHNRQFGVSWAISSAFASGSNIINDIDIERLEYSRKFTRPLLYNDHIRIMILNKTTHFNSDYLTDYYQLNDDNNDNNIRFCYLKFSVEKQCLNRISLCYPDSNGIIIAEELLLNRQQIALRVAA